MGATVVLFAVGARRLIEGPGKDAGKSLLRIKAILEADIVDPLIGVAQIAGGQQQRCAIGRALVKNPGLLLCDEPTGALDYKTSKEILQLMEDVNHEYGCTIIIVTHNAAIARMANRVLRLHDGRIVEDELNESPIAAAELDW